MSILNIVLMLALVQQDPLPVQIHKMLKAGDAYNVALVMESFGEPRTVATNYQEVSNYLYWTAGDLPSFTVFARQGIDYNLAKAREVSSTNAQLATNLRSAAAVLAFNLASYTWPGWAEPSIQITAA